MARKKKNTQKQQNEVELETAKLNEEPSTKENENVKENVEKSKFANNKKEGELVEKANNLIEKLEEFASGPAYITTYIASPFNLFANDQVDDDMKMTEKEIDDMLKILKVTKREFNELTAMAHNIVNDRKHIETTIEQLMPAQLQYLKDINNKPEELVKNKEILDKLEKLVCINKIDHKIEEKIWPFEFKYLDDLVIYDYSYIYVKLSEGIKDKKIKEIVESLLDNGKENLAIKTIRKYVAQRKTIILAKLAVLYKWIQELREIDIECKDLAKEFKKDIEGLEEVLVRGIRLVVSKELTDEELKELVDMITSKMKLETIDEETDEDVFLALDKTCERIYELSTELVSNEIISIPSEEEVKDMLDKLGPNDDLVIEINKAFLERENELYKHVLRLQLAIIDKYTNLYMKILKEVFGICDELAGYIPTEEEYEVECNQKTTEHIRKYLYNIALPNILVITLFAMVATSILVYDLIYGFDLISTLLLITFVVISIYMVGKVFGENEIHRTVVLNRYGNKTLNTIFFVLAGLILLGWSGLHTLVEVGLQENLKTLYNKALSLTEQNRQLNNALISKEQTISQLNDNVDQLRIDLSNTKDKLNKCEADKEGLINASSSVLEQLRNATNLLDTAIMKYGTGNDMTGVDLELNDTTGNNEPTQNTKQDKTGVELNIGE